MYTFIHQWRCQLCKATASWLGAVRFGCLAQGHLNTKLGGAGVRTSNFPGYQTIILSSSYCHPAMELHAFGPAKHWHTRPCRRTAKKTIGVSLPSIQDIFRRRVHAERLPSWTTPPTPHADHLTLCHQDFAASESALRFWNKFFPPSCQTFETPSEETTLHQCLHRWLPVSFGIDLKCAFKALNAAWGCCVYLWYASSLCAWALLEIPQQALRTVPSSWLITKGDPEFSVGALSCGSSCLGISGRQTQYPLFPLTFIEWLFVNWWNWL